MIAAVARNRVIGLRNGLPWRLPGDMRRFKAMTMGKPVIMGRKTFQSIGRPMPGRTVIVVTRDGAFASDGIVVVHGLAEAVARATEVAVRTGATEVMVAGGAEIYAAAMGSAQRLHITAVDLAPEGDTLFPPIRPADWREVSRETPALTPADACAHAFVTYERRRPGAP